MSGCPDFRTLRRLDRMTPAERFWAKVRKGDGCWEWRGCVSQRGYGVAKVDGRLKSASRYSWELAHGEIPAGMFVCHHCDNPPCVRPDHLFLGTPADNVRDAQRKGRLKPPPRTGGRKFPPGEGHPSAKLTEQQVREIRALHAAGGVTLKSLSERYGVGSPAVCQIVNRNAWTHVADVVEIGHGPAS